MTAYEVDARPRAGVFSTATTAQTVPGWWPCAACFGGPSRTSRSRRTILSGRRPNPNTATLSIRRQLPGTRFPAMRGDTGMCSGIANSLPVSQSVPTNLCTIQTRPPSADAPASPPAPTPLPEAPAAVNVPMVISSRQVQLTVHDSDETRLLARLEAVLQHFPAPPPTAQSTGWCKIHQTRMRETQKNGHRWFSHRTSAGWCKGMETPPRALLRLHKRVVPQ